jgi:hypothetical protein
VATMPQLTFHPVHSPFINSHERVGCISIEVGAVGSPLPIVPDSRPQNTSQECFGSFEPTRIADGSSLRAFNA